MITICLDIANILRMHACRKWGTYILAIKPLNSDCKLTTAFERRRRPSLHRVVSTSQKSGTVAALLHERAQLATPAAKGNVEAQCCSACAAGPVPGCSSSGHRYSAIECRPQGTHSPCDGTAAVRRSSHLARLILIDPYLSRDADKSQLPVCQDIGHHQAQECRIPACRGCDFVLPRAPSQPACVLQGMSYTSLHSHNSLQLTHTVAPHRSVDARRSCSIAARSAAPPFAPLH